jgi:hypothetical protein
MKRLYLSVAVEMDPDPFVASDTYARIREPWNALLASLNAGGIAHEAKADEMEVRAKAKRAPRKPRLVTPTEAA